MIFALNNYHFVNFHQFLEIGINWKEFPLNPTQPTAKPNKEECVNNAPLRKRGPPYINTGRRVGADPDFMYYLLSIIYYLSSDFSRLTFLIHQFFSKRREQAPALRIERKNGVFITLVRTAEDVGPYISPFHLEEGL